MISLGYHQGPINCIVDEIVYLRGSCVLLSPSDVYEMKARLTDCLLEHVNKDSGYWASNIHYILYFWSLICLGSHRRHNHIGIYRSSSAHG